MFSTQLITLWLPCYTLPPMQHHSFFRNSPPFIHLTSFTKLSSIKPFNSNLVPVCFYLHHIQCLHRRIHNLLSPALLHIYKQHSFFPGYLLFLTYSQIYPTKRTEHLFSTCLWQSRIWSTGIWDNKLSGKVCQCSLYFPLQDVLSL